MLNQQRKIEGLLCPAHPEEHATGWINPLSVERCLDCGATTPMLSVYCPIYGRVLVRHLTPAEKVFYEPHDQG